MNESLPAPARTTPRSKGKLIRGKITLLGSNPKIWRAFEVDSRLYLDEFHQVLQVMMGWEDSHLHSFTEHNPNTPGRRPSTARSWAPVYVRAEDDDGWYAPEETVRVGKSSMKAPPPCSTNTTSETAGPTASTGTKP